MPIRTKAQNTAMVGGSLTALGAYAGALSFLGPLAVPVGIASALLAHVAGISRTYEEVNKRKYIRDHSQILQRQALDQRSDNYGYAQADVGAGNMQIGGGLADYLGVNEDTPLMVIDSRGNIAYTERPGVIRGEQLLENKLIGPTPMERDPAVFPVEIFGKPFGNTHCARHFDTRKFYLNEDRTSLGGQWARFKSFMKRSFGLRSKRWDAQQFIADQNVPEGEIWVPEGSDYLDRLGIKDAVAGTTGLAMARKSGSVYRPRKIVVRRGIGDKIRVRAGQGDFEDSNIQELAIITAEDVRHKLNKSRYMDVTAIWEALRAQNPKMYGQVPEPDMRPADQRIQDERQRVDALDNFNAWADNLRRVYGGRNEQLEDLIERRRRTLRDIERDRGALVGRRHTDQEYRQRRLDELARDAQERGDEYRRLLGDAGVPEDQLDALVNAYMQPYLEGIARLGQAGQGAPAANQAPVPANHVPVPAPRPGNANHGNVVREVVPAPDADQGGLEERIVEEPEPPAPPEAVRHGGRQNPRARNPQRAQGPNLDPYINMRELFPRWAEEMNARYQQAQAQGGHADIPVEEMLGMGSEIVERNYRRDNHIPDGQQLEQAIVDAMPTSLMPLLRKTITTPFRGPNGYLRLAGPRDFRQKTIRVLNPIQINEIEIERAEQRVRAEPAEEEPGAEHNDAGEPNPDGI